MQGGTSLGPGPPHFSCVAQQPDSAQWESKTNALKIHYVKIIFEIDIVDKVCGEKNITNNIEGCCMM